ncbi:MAG TPA: hypothetical protein VG273_07170 [Bryobacteraceae bacterium]|jgi:hypothetical protein|nr:hypothetical protein [Bryobacteraceae bacterium]
MDVAEPDLELQLPVLADKIFPETAVRSFAGQLETRARVDAAGRHQDALCPKHDFAIPGRPREPDAFVYQGAPQVHAAADKSKFFNPRSSAFIGGRLILGFQQSLQIFLTNPCSFGDLRKHFRPDLFPIVKPSRLSVRCDPRCLLTCQPIRSSAASTRLALLAGQLPIAYRERNSQSRRGKLTVGNSVRDDRDSKPFGRANCFFSRCPVTQYASEFECFRDPATVVFTVKING